MIIVPAVGLIWRFVVLGRMGSKLNIESLESYLRIFFFAIVIPIGSTFEILAKATLKLTIACKIAQLQKGIHQARATFSMAL